MSTILTYVQSDGKVDTLNDCLYALCTSYVPRNCRHIVMVIDRAADSSEGAKAVQYWSAKYQRWIGHHAVGPLDQAILRKRMLESVYPIVIDEPEPNGAVFARVHVDYVSFIDAETMPWADWLHNLYEALQTGTGDVVQGVFTFRVPWSVKPRIAPTPYDNRPYGSNCMVRTSSLQEDKIPWILHNRHAVVSIRPAWRSLSTWQAWRLGWRFGSYQDCRTRRGLSQVVDGLRRGGAEGLAEIGEVFGAILGRTEA